MPNINPYRDLAKLEGGSSSDQDYSSNISYDYSGADLAHKYGAQLGEARASHADALLRDPMSSVATGKRIGELARYMRAFKGGYNLPDHEVLPAARISSFQESFGNKHSGSGGATFYDPDRLLRPPESK